MPLIVRCDNCAKFNLVEDEKRGTQVACFLCHGAIPKAGTSTIVVVCPKPECNTKMQIPTAAAGGKLQCPKCGGVF